MSLETEATKAAVTVTQTATTVTTFWAKYGKYVTAAAALAVGVVIGHLL